MKKVFFIIVLIYSVKLVAEEQIIYKYKKNQKVDLGDLAIKGDVIAPSDISISVENRKEFQRKLYNRSDYQYEIRNKVLNLR